MKHLYCIVPLVLALAWPCACPAQENLLVNGDCEASEIGEAPLGWGLLLHSDAGEGQQGAELPLETTRHGRNGTRAVRLRTSGDSPLAYVQQYVPIPRESSARYVFSVWLRAEKPASVGLHLYYTPKGQREGGPLRTRSSVSVGTEWKQYEVVLDDGFAVRLEDEYTLRPIIQPGSSAGYVELDDAGLAVSPSEVIPATRARLDAFEKSLREGPATVKAPIGITGGIVVGDDGQLLAFGSDFTVLASGDGGRTWDERRPLAIKDKFGHVTGAIRTSDGTIGLWNEGWKKPMYFWRSTDGGRTWSKRTQIAQEGAPLHGNVMIEMSGGGDIVPGRWKRDTHSKTGERNSPSSKSTFTRIPGGRLGDHAGGMMLDEADEWMYAEQWMRTDRPLRKGDEYVFRVATKADEAAAFELYIEAWNHETGNGSRNRMRFEGEQDWTDREIKLTVSEHAEGLSSIRLIVQFYTPGVLLRIDDARMERVAPADGKKSFTLSNASFEHVRPRRLVIPVREGYAFSGLQSEYGSYGTDMGGKRVLTEGHGHMMEMCLTYVYYSDDWGDTWRRNADTIVIWKDDGYGGSWEADEPNVAELSDGRLLMFLRCPLGRIYQTFSLNRGARWAYPTATDLPASLSPCSLKRIPENEHTVKTGRAGDLLVVWNNVGNDEIRRGFRRGRLSAAVSTDDAKTWQHVKTIDAAGLPVIKGAAPLSPPGMVRGDKDLGELPIPFGNVSYPDIVFTGDHVIVKYMKAFTNPSFHMDTVMQILPLDWFYED